MNAIRIHKHISSVTPDWPELRPFIGRDVEVIVVEEEPAPVQPAMPPDSTAFWQSRSIDQLAAAQQVRAPSSADDLAGDWPEEDSLDAFLKFVQEARR